jgi:dTDP-4-dehydrorhamnose 3,5-epimerase
MTRVSRTTLNDCLIIEPEIFTDERGLFLETYQNLQYKKLLGINLDFVQDNFSHSIFGTLRGLHFQKTKPQGKLVRVTRGSILDVAVDLRRDSPSFGEYFSIELNDKLHQQLWVPPGFAHGFLVLSDEADVAYKCTNYFYPEDEGSIIWNDQNLNINWPKNIQILISKKDSQAQTFLQFCQE